MIPAYSPEARGRSERNFGTWQGRLPQELRLRQLGTLEAANRFLREDYIAEFNRRFQVASRQRGNAFSACRGRDLERGALAGDVGRLPGHGASALGWNSQPHPRAALAGTLHGRRDGAERDKN